MRHATCDTSHAACSMEHVMHQLWRVRRGMSDMACGKWRVRHGMSDVAWRVRRGMSDMACDKWRVRHAMSWGRATDAPSPPQHLRHNTAPAAPRIMSSSSTSSTVTQATSAEQVNASHACMHARPAAAPTARYSQRRLQQPKTPSDVNEGLTKVRI